MYEISGNECCLSTGDLLKIMAVALQKVICEDTETGQTTELPPTFKGEQGCPVPARTQWVPLSQGRPLQTLWAQLLCPTGLFQSAPAPGPYPTPQRPFLEGSRQRGLTLHQVLEQWDGRPQPLLCPAISPHILLLHPVYEVHAAMHRESGRGRWGAGDLGQGAVWSGQGCCRVRVRMLRGQSWGTEGLGGEAGDAGELGWGCCRDGGAAEMGPYTVLVLGPQCTGRGWLRGAGGGRWVFSPTWGQGEAERRVRAALPPAVRRDVVKIPSTLEVDVEDVTEEAQHVHFARPLLLSEVLGMEEALPAQAEILEGPAGPAVFESAWVTQLQRGQRLQLHGCSHAWRVLATAPSSGRHFLLSSAYQGRFRRRPRQFAGVQELAAGLRPGRRLHVVVTQDCEGRGDDVPPLGVGDRLEARGLQGNGPSTRLLCHRHGGEEEEEEEGEELLLPLDLGGSFVEETCDSKKYGLVELLERQPLPCEVRVAAPDPGLERDALGTLPALRLEARLDQPFLVGSFCQEPEEGFEIPPRWLDFSLLLSEAPVRPLAPCTRRSRVEELTEAFYYRLLAQLPGSPTSPPPRPPKRAQVGTSPGGRHPSTLSSPPVSTCTASPLPPLPALPRPSTPKLYGRQRAPRKAGEAPGTYQAPAPPQGSGHRRAAMVGGRDPHISVSRPCSGHHLPEAVLVGTWGKDAELGGAPMGAAPPHPLVPGAGEDPQVIAPPRVPQVGLGCPSGSAPSPCPTNRGTYGEAILTPCPTWGPWHEGKQGFNSMANVTVNTTNKPFSSIYY